VAFSAEIFLPFGFDIDRMLKFHHAVDNGILNLSGGALRNDRVAHVAVF
jgi:hypothetical protein